MRWRPATLLVESSPKLRNAFFRFKAPPRLARTPPHPVGLPYTVTFPKSAPLEATLQVYAVGYYHVLREVQLVPGQRSRVRVRLRRLRNPQGAGCMRLDDCRHPP